MADENKRLTELVHEMRDEGDLHNPPRPGFTWRGIIGVLTAIVVTYFLLVAALVLIRA